MGSEYEFQNCVLFKHTHTHTHIYMWTLVAENTFHKPIDNMYFCEFKFISSNNSTACSKLHKPNICSGIDESYVWAEKHGLTVCYNWLDKSHSWVHKSIGHDQFWDPSVLRCLRWSTGHLVATQFQWNFERESNFPHQVFFLPSCFASASTTTEL